MDLFRWFAAHIVDFPWGTVFTLLLLALLILSIILLAFLIATLFLGLWHLLNSSFRPQLRASGIVTRKCYEPESTYLMLIQSGEATIFIPQQTSASYNLLIKIEAGYGWIAVKASFYNSVSIGNYVYVTYCVGRFSSQIYLKNIWK
jgi:hypothetical protein